MPHIKKAKGWIPCFVGFCFCTRWQLLSYNRSSFYYFHIMTQIIRSLTTFTDRHYCFLLDSSEADNTVSDPEDKGWGRPQAHSKCVSTAFLSNEAPFLYLLVFLHAPRETKGGNSAINTQQYTINKKWSKCLHLCCSLSLESPSPASVYLLKSFSHTSSRKPCPDPQIRGNSTFVIPQPDLGLQGDPTSTS